MEGAGGETTGGDSTLLLLFLRERDNLPVSEEMDSDLFEVGGVCAAGGEDGTGGVLGRAMVRTEDVRLITPPMRERNDLLGEGLGGDDILSRR